MPGHEPIFIMGAPRSGTTLLFQMLDSHPEVHLLNEFWKLYPYLTGEVVDPGALDQLLRSHLRLPRSQQAGPDGPPGGPFEQLEAAIVAKLASVGKGRWGIKDPRLLPFAELLLDRYPESRWLLIVRDPRAVVRSQIGTKTTVANAYHGARIWERQIRRGTLFKERHPESCHELRYERLLREPEAVLRGVCGFAGVAYDSTLLDYHEHRGETTIHEGNVNVTRPLDAGRADAWRHELSPRQIDLIEAVAGPVMDELGYERVGSPIRIGPVQRLLFDAHQRAMTNYWWQRRKLSESR